MDPVYKFSITMKDFGGKVSFEVFKVDIKIRIFEYITIISSQLE